MIQIKADTLTKTKEMILTFEITVGMFMELVAKPMPNVIAASTPRNSATNDSRRRWISRLPVISGYTAARFCS